MADGQSNPFGNGGGAARAPQKSFGNDFNQNPRGANKGTKPRDFIDASRRQPVMGKGGGDGALNQQEIPEGGAVLQADPVAAPSRGSQHGAGTPSKGGGAKPFKLGGGGE